MLNLSLKDTATNGAVPSTTWDSVRDALVAAGIEAGRIRTVSYGKERPFVLGHDENAWKFNRRAHVVQE